MSTIHLRLESLAPAELQQLCGPGNRYLQRIEQHFDVRFLGQPGDWQVEGDRAEAAAALVRRLIGELNGKGAGEGIGDVTLEGMLRDHEHADHTEARHDAGSGDVLIAGRRHIRGKTNNQRKYLKTIQEQVLTIAVGPAGSGKTYLAVAAAVAALASNQVERIILTRPAVEAGEKLGFLPGDLQQKIDPYLRPLFDALADMLGIEKMNAMQESGRIEIAPLAYMRGRTLNDAFVILDEAQNTTREQMKMFLTRLGFGSRMVVTGDITQVDLPRHTHSGLLHAMDVLKGVEEVGHCRMSGRDVVRHRLVERIVNAYESSDNDRSS